MNTITTLRATPNTLQRGTVPWTAVALAAALMALTACGGGGSSATGSAPALALKSPPTQSASLSGTDTEAVQAVQAVVAGAGDFVQDAALLSGGYLPVNTPFGNGQAQTSFWQPGPASKGREQAMVKTTVGCTEFLSSPCTGSASLDTNADLNANVLPAGTYLDMSFANLSGSFGSETVAFNGGIRLDMLTALDTLAAAPANARVQFTFSAFSATVSGVTVGPVSAVALLEFDGQGHPSFTLNGRSFAASSAVTRTDANNYAIAQGSMRTAHWANANQYVDMAFSGWQVAAQRPASGALTTVSAGTGSAAVSVVSSSANQVVYRVAYGGGAGAKAFLVTANYSNGTPSYSAAATN